MASSKVSAGLLMYRRHDGKLEVLLVHPGGPFFKNRDEGAWSIPKGLVVGDEDLLSAAIREFEEETGLHPRGPFLALRPIIQKSGKIVHAWAFEGDCDPARIRSNTFEIEWPPRSGKKQVFPEIDKAEFFDLPTARKKILPAQLPFLDELEAQLRS